MTPGVYPLVLYRGDSYRWQFTCWDDVAQSVPSDLTDVTAISQIRDKPGGTFICLISCTIELPNLINAYLTARDCASLPASAAWDLQLTYPSGDVATLLAGSVNVTPDVSNSEPIATPAPVVVLPRAHAR